MHSVNIQLNSKLHPPPKFSGSAPDHGAMPPIVWPCNKRLKPNYQSVISQTNYGCNLLSQILTKLLLLDIGYENVFALSIVTCNQSIPFFGKKCVKKIVFYAKTVKICWRLRATSPNPHSLRRLGVSPSLPRLYSPPSFAKSLVRHWRRHIMMKRRIFLVDKKNILGWQAGAEYSWLESGGKLFLDWLKKRISSQNVP